MHSWHEFWTMGGYARYVWPAYGITLFVFVAMTWVSRRGLRQATREAGRGARGGRP